MGLTDMMVRARTDVKCGLAPQRPLDEGYMKAYEFWMGVIWIPIKLDTGKTEKRNLCVRR